jgi:hypothetical protein
VRALVQFPEIMDMMCMKLDWTTELGQAFTADQAGVLDAVQRGAWQVEHLGRCRIGDSGLLRRHGVKRRPVGAADALQHAGHAR